MRMYTDGIGNKHIVIETTAGRYLQSYDSIVAARLYDGRGRILSSYWNYSVTTSRHVNEFFGESVRNNLEHYTVLPVNNLTVEGK